MNPEDYTIEDILSMSDRERDRLVAEWLGERLIIIKEQDREPIEKVYVVRSGLKIEEDEKAPQYHKKWKDCGRILDALPAKYKAKPVKWMTDNLTYKPEDGSKIMRDNAPLSKDHIVFAACICWLQGIEPYAGGE